MEQPRLTRRISRRYVLKTIVAGAAGAAGSSSFPAPAISQAPIKIKMALPWLAQGAQLYPFIARHKGYWRRNGLEVEIARGYGSGAAIQTVTQGQFDVGLIAWATLILSAAKGVDMRALSVCGYDSTFGLVVLDDSPVKTAKDLEGRKIGSTTTSNEAPYVDAFLHNSGVDASKVTRVQLAAPALESTLINKQVDAISGNAQSQIANLMGLGIKSRFLPFTAVGINLYALTCLVSPTVYETKKTMCEAWTDGMNEAVKFCMTHFDEAVDIFVNEVPEIRMASKGKDLARIGAGLFVATQMVPEVKDHGHGWANFDSLNKQIDLVMKFVVGADGKRPDASRIFTNEFAGKFKMSAAEWEAARAAAAPYASVLDMKI